MRNLAILGAIALAIATAPAARADDSAKSPAKPEAAKPEVKPDAPDKLAPFPADRTVRQRAVIAGRPIAYDATVGTIPVRDAEGKLTGEVMFTAYTVPGGGDRPVTFAFNGGPGAASVYLNLGAVGPRRVQFGAAGDAPSDSPALVDNANSWLDFTDLVFIDPIGTGFSRSREDLDRTKKDFWSTEADIKYLSRVVYDWLLNNGRMRSAKYVMGESYGGYRTPRIAYELQTHLGVGVNGVVMVSPYLDPAAIGDGTALSPLPWLIALPSMAAARLEREGRLSPQALAPVEAYARHDFVVDFLAGRSDTAADARIVEKMSEFTGLPRDLVARLHGRIDIDTFLRESHRGEAKIGSVYDSNVTAFDPFPASAERRSGDPILDALIAPTTSAMVDFITREVGWKVAAPYRALSEDVGRNWDRDPSHDAPVTDLRKAMANDPRMKVLIVHGANDLSCPYFASRLILDQMPAFGAAPRLAVYPGGHMFYSRPGSAAAFRHDAMALYGR